MAHDDPEPTVYLQTSLVNFMSNANISFPLKTEIGIELMVRQSGRCWAIYLTDILKY